MGWLQDWATVMNLVLRHPKKFFADMGPVDEFDHPVKFAVTSQLIIALFGGVTRPVITSLTETTFNLNVLGIVLGVVGSFIQGIAGVFVGAAVIHVFVALLGGSGYTRTFAVVAYSTAIGVIGSAVSVLLSALLLPFLGTAPGTVAGLILIVALLVGLGLVGYTLYVQVVGIKEFHGLSGRRAAAAVLLPVAIIIIFLIIVLVIGAVVFMNMQTGGTLPTAPPTTP